jgi:hypothetical protein
VSAGRAAWINNESRRKKEKMMNIKLTGCGPKYAGLLKHAGYNRTDLLCGVTPLYLHNHLVTINSQLGVVAKVPRLPTVEQWVYEARNAPTGLIIAGKYFIEENPGIAGVEESANVVEGRALIALPGAEDSIGMITIGQRGGRRGPGKKRSDGTQLPGDDRKKKPPVPRR